MRYLYDLPIVKVRAWLEIGGKTGDGFVNVGENTTLRLMVFNYLLTKNISIKLSNILVSILYYHAMLVQKL